MTLKLGSPEQKMKMITQFKRSVSILIDNVISLCYHMKGGITYDELMHRTPGERQRMAEFIERLHTTPSTP